MSKIYWGDIHNHCDISYGYGSLKNALRNAKNHLDFCAVTGHAMWPDMYDDKPEVEFVVGFHKNGFKKFNAKWENEVKPAVKQANDEGLVTFQAYEMHSSEFGDHHIVSPDDELPLFYPNTPKELVEQSYCDAITVAHHIGYTPGYRGIDWDKHDEKITPLIEVISKHGCGMSETAPGAYYHNMGPRDSGNTVYRGLLKGKHIGFVGSTDHHAGYPGSYGDGKMAVLATEKTRQAIWDAMLNRRTYAVSGDRILCNFTVNGNVFGSVVNGDKSKTREIEFDVRCCYNIDKIVILKNTKPLHVVEGLLLEPKSSDDMYKFRIEMGWGDNDNELYKWSGNVSVSGGEIADVEPCFRGKSVLAPSALSTDGHSDANDVDSKIITQSPDKVEWQCFTLKNTSPMHPQTSAVIIEVKGSLDTKVEIDVNGHKKTTTIGALTKAGYTGHMEYYHSQAFKVHPVITKSMYCVSAKLIDKDIASGNDFYHMEVYQQNGSSAYVSPVYFTST